MTHMNLSVLIRNARMYIESKEIFRDWHLSTLDYFLSKAGLRDCVRVRCMGKKACVDPVLYRTAVWAYYNGFIKGIDCMGNAIALNDTWLSINEFGHAEVSVDGVNMVFLSFKPTFFDVFVLRDYDVVDYRNRRVVDVGAFVGDSSIYFVKRGATFVYAIEPNNSAYSELILNAEMNGVRDAIKPINMTVGRNGTSLAKLIEDYGIKTDILKMDCEGCEYDVVLNPTESINEINEIVMELHKWFGDYHKVKYVLKKYFDCQAVRTNEEVEILHCIKKK